MKEEQKLKLDFQEITLNGGSNNVNLSALITNILQKFAAVKHCNN